MGNDINISPISFFDDPEAESIFARLDFGLKDGIHIQSHSTQYDLFNFLVKHEDSLRLFYAKYYGLKLSCAGVGENLYFFLDFIPGDRGEIDVDHRNFLKPEYVVIGFFIHKICYIDRNFDLNSVKKLQLVILHDYEDMKPDLNRLLAKLRKSNTTTLTDSKISDIIVETLKEFKKIGWIVMEEDFFDVLPSFQRLVMLYKDYINNIDELIKTT